MAEKMRADGGGEVLITISADETPKATLPSVAFKPQSTPYSPGKESNSGAAVSTKTISINDHSSEISRFVPIPNKPPQIPVSNENLTRRRSLARSVFSKPKSRFGEQPIRIDDPLTEEEILSIQEEMSRNSSYKNSFNRSGSSIHRSVSIRTNSITQKISVMENPCDHEDEDEVEDVIKKVEYIREKNNGISAKVVIQWIVFVFLVACLVASLTVEKLEKTMIWGLEIWKWCVLLLVIFSGMLITNWFVHFIVFMIERNYLLRKKVLYFVYGLKKSVQVFVWIGFVLLAWTFLFDGEGKRSKTASTILKCVTWILVSLLIGSFLWLVKNLLIKILASNFHVNKFFDRIQESVFHQYVLQTLSGPPHIEEAERVGKSASTGQLSFRSTVGGKTKEKKVIDMGMLHKLKSEKVSAWTMKVLIDAVTNSGLSTISNTLEESVCGKNYGQIDTEITNEMEATAAAYHIFNNVAKPGAKYIDEEDLLRFMIKEEVDLVLPLFELSETGQIDRKSLTDWGVKVYKGRKALAHALGDTKTAVKQLNKLVTVVLIIATVFIWLILMEIATTKVLMVLLSQLIVGSFIFKNTFKNIFESMVFVFVMHPFDVGDRCVVDGLPLLVEEMNILTTVFLKLNNEKVYHPNNVLATKAISNYYRSPDMSDTVDFSIDFATSIEKIGLLKEKIKLCLENNPHHWHPNHSVVVKEMENVNTLKMALYCNHTMNFQEYGERNNRRTELIIEMKKIFEELDIKYSLLPQQVLLRHFTSESTVVTRM